jgi:hypothetical protein
MPKIARDYEFTGKAGGESFILDGEEFPWYIGEEYTVDEVADGLMSLNVSILVDIRNSEIQ